MSLPRERFDTVVIGGGPGGLATSRELTRNGVDHVVLERGDAVGWSWRNAYESLTLHTGKHLSGLPGLRPGRAAPLFLPRDAFVDYLDRYTHRFGLPVVTGCEVTRADPTANGWELATTMGPLSASRLVLATGIMSNPYLPSLRGEERFDGRVMHSIEYRRPEPFLGRRVVVVGAGNSAGEIASELAAADVEVTLSIRSGANVVPRQLLGIPIQYLAWVVGGLPPAARGAVVSLVQRITRARRGPPVLPPAAAGPLDSIPIIGFNLVDAISAGRITLAGAIRELVPGGVRFEDDDEAAADDIILATGFRAAVRPVSHTIRLDDRGFARRRERVIAEDAPDLYLVGHNYDATGGLFNIRRDAPSVGRLIAGGA